MRTLRILDSPVEAEILKSRLDAAGILAVVNGGEVGTMLSHIGTAAVRVRVEVAPEDFERAEAVLKEDDLERSERSAWRCRRCDEPNEPLFDLCWACGKQRVADDQVQDGVDPPAVSRDDRQLPLPAPVVSEGEVPVPRSDDNPYAPPRRPGGKVNPPVSMPDQQPDATTEETVARAFRGAVIGTVIIPPLLSMYVIGMLVFMVPRYAYRTPKLRRKLILSWVLCACSFLFASVLLFSYF